MTKLIPELTASDIARFWAKVDARADDECWHWLAATNKAGYGRFGIGGRAGKTFLAHRVSAALDGREPGDHHTLHRCDNPPCVNPAHLWNGTDADNVADMVAKGRCNPARGIAHSNTMTRVAARGERVNTAKLTDEQIPIIRADPRACRAIAAEYGVAHSQIVSIKSGKAWAHVV